MTHQKRIGAVDIGGSKIAEASVSVTGNVLARRECRTDAARRFDALRRMETMLCWVVA